MMAAAAMLFGACCEKQCDTINPTGVVMDNILSRKSVRSYNGEAIPDSVMENILRAAMAAPSGRDWRPWSFVVLTDPSEYDTIFEGNFNMEKFKRAAAVFVLCADTTVTRTPRGGGEPVTMPNGTWRDDLGAATENLLLAAESMGLGACWTASYPYEDRYMPPKKALGLPDTVIPYAIVPVGYPAGDEQPKDKWDPAKVHYGRW